MGILTMRLKDVDISKCIMQAEKEGNSSTK